MPPVVEKTRGVKTPCSTSLILCPYWRFLSCSTTSIRYSVGSRCRLLLLCEVQLFSSIPRGKDNSKKYASRGTNIHTEEMMLRTPASTTEGLYRWLFFWCLDIELDIHYSKHQSLKGFHLPSLGKVTKFFVCREMTFRTLVVGAHSHLLCFLIAAQLEKGDGNL